MFQRFWQTWDTGVRLWDSLPVLRAGRIERGVRSLGFDSDFIQVEKGMSRINVKLKSDQESEINGMGPEITAGDVDQLFEKLSYLKKEDVLVLSGSIPAAVGMIFTVGSWNS